MKKLLCLVALVPSLAFGAAATWAPVDAAKKCALNGISQTSNCRSVTGTCASGTCDAPTLATQGMSLDAVGSYKVSVAAPATKTIAGGKLAFYYWSEAAGIWIPDTSKDLTIPAAAARAYTWDGDSPGLGVVVILPKGRIAYVPSGATAADGCSVYIEAAGAEGQDL